MENKQVENTNEVYSQILSFAKLKKLALADLTTKSKSAILKKYPRDDIVRYLENPDTNYTKLQEMSLYLYAVSPNYKRLVNYLSELPTDNYFLTPVDIGEDVENFKEQYALVCKKYKRQSLKNILPMIRREVILTGEYFGICFESKTDFCLRKMPNQYCRVSSMESGSLVFSFNLDFFNDKNNYKFIKEYGNDFVKAYRKYKGDKELGIKGDKTAQWFEPKHQICIKIDMINFEYSLPYFAGLFDSILDINEYNQIKKDKAVAQNQKIVTLEMDRNDSGLPSMTLEMAKPYYDMVGNNMPDNVGVALAPFKFGSFAVQDETANANDIALEANKQFWSNAGVSSLLFGIGDNPTSQSLLISIKTDEAMVYELNVQIAKALDTRFKKTNPKYLFSITILEQSKFTKDEVINQFTKGASYGLPVKSALLAAHGLEPLDVINMNYLEDIVLEFTISTLNKPLLQSSTMSPDSENGRPTNAEQGLGTADNTERGMDNNSENR